MASSQSGIPSAASRSPKLAVWPLRTRSRSRRSSARSTWICRTRLYRLNPRAFARRELERYLERLLEPEAGLRAPATRLRGHAFGTRDFLMRGVLLVGGGMTGCVARTFGPQPALYPCAALVVGAGAAASARTRQGEPGKVPGDPR